LAKRDKLRRKLRENPADATMQEVETLLQRFGFSRVRISRSRHIYEYQDGDIWRQIVVPLHGRKVKKVYVKKVVEIIDGLFPEEDSEVDDD